MDTKINGVEPRAIGVAGSQPVSRLRETASGADSGAAGLAGADVSITDGARQLATLEKAIAALPVVDEARVSATALALEQGRYHADPLRIADRLIRSGAEMSDAGGGEK